MKKITVSIDEETYRLARIRAAELDTSVSALVRDYLRSLASGSRDAEKEVERRRELMRQVFEDFEASCSRRSTGCLSAKILRRSDDLVRR